VSYIKGELQFEGVFCKVLKKVFRNKMEELTGGWIKNANEELNDFYSSPNTIRLFESRKLIGVGCVVHIGNTVMHTGFWAGKPDRKIPF
jgi:hypothetical protein